MQNALGLPRLLLATANTFRWRRPLSPALLVLLPAWTLIYQEQGVDQAALLRVFGMFAICGGYLFLALVVEAFGQNTESALHRAWGGRPSVCMLRHRDSEVLEGAKRAWHAFYAAHLKTTFPTAAEEQRDALLADGQYARAVAWSERHAQDCFNFRRLSQARLKYQFLLHCLALRWIGLVVAIGTAAWACIGRGAVSMVSQQRFELTVSMSLQPSSVATLGLCAGMIAGWLFFFTPARVRAAACAYDLHLLECAASDSTPPSRTAVSE